MLYIHPDECVDCGACEPVCPVEAIFYEDDVPGGMAEYTARQRRLLRRDRLPRRGRQAGPDRLRRAAGQGPPAAGARPLRALPDFPWDRLAPATRRGRRQHPDGIVDLSIGTPVDPTPRSSARPWPAAADCARLPPDHRRARDAGGDLTRGCRAGSGRPTACDVLPTIGTKEFVAWLPTMLGLGAERPVVIPELAYPTYDVGARLAGAQLLATDSLTALGPARGRPPVAQLARATRPAGCCPPSTWPRWSPGHGSATRWSSPTSATTSWPGPQQPVSVLHPDVCGGDPTGVLALHSLSKRSNLAGYRFGFAAGDPAVIAAPPRGPQARRDDGAGSRAGRRRRRPRPTMSTWSPSGPLYGSRRDLLIAALTGAGFRIDESAAGLYLWATRESRAGTTVGWLAERGHPRRAGRVLRAARRPARPRGPHGDRRAGRRRRGTARRLSRRPARERVPDVGSPCQDFAPFPVERTRTHAGPP